MITIHFKFMDDAEWFVALSGDFHLHRDGRRLSLQTRDFRLVLFADQAVDARTLSQRIQADVHRLKVEPGEVVKHTVVDCSRGWKVEKMQSFFLGDRHAQ